MNSYSCKLLNTSLSFFSDRVNLCCSGVPGPGYEMKDDIFDIDNFIEFKNKCVENFKNGIVSDNCRNCYEIRPYDESAVFDKRKIKLMLKTRVIMECIPLKIIENKGKIFFNVYYKNKERMIDSDRVSGIEILTNKFVQNFNDPSVIFLLREDLACRYDLRENEQYIESDKKGWTAVSNRGENKDILFARLLRYDSKCEIVSPKIYREEMKQLLDDALNNYGE